MEWAKTMKDQKAVMEEEQLEEAFLAGVTEEQRRTSARVNRTEEESLRVH